MCKQGTEVLKQICKEVKEDIKNMPEEMKWVHTTEDFFRYRDDIKSENKENSLLRNEIVENTIAGNKTLGLLYDWTKFYRILDKSRARVFILKEELYQSDIYDNEAIEQIDFSSTCPLYSYLAKNADIDMDGLFDMIKVGGFGFRYNEFPTFHTLYEFLKKITHEEIYGPFAIDILICLFRACNISGEDLILCARAVEEEANELIQKLSQDIPFKKDKQKLYVKA